MVNKKGAQQEKSITVKVDKKLHACIKAQADLAGVNLQEYVNKIFKEYFAR